MRKPFDETEDDDQVSDDFSIGFESGWLAAKEAVLAEIKEQGSVCVDCLNEDIEACKAALGYDPESNKN